MIIDTAFGFFLDLSKVIAIHKPVLTIDRARSGISAWVSFEIDGGTHAGKVSYRRSLYEWGQSRHPCRDSGPIDNYHALELLVRTDDEDQWVDVQLADELAASGKARVVGLLCLQVQVEALVAQWRHSKLMEEKK